VVQKVWQGKKTLKKVSHKKTNVWQGPLEQIRTPELAAISKWISLKQPSFKIEREGKVGRAVYKRMRR